MKRLIPILILSLLICNCSYNLYVVQIIPSDLKETNKNAISREEQQTNPAMGAISKAPNRNFTDVHNSGNILYLTIDTQTPKVITTQASIPVSVSPIP